MDIPSPFRAAYTTCLVNPSVFDGYDVAPEEYLEILQNSDGALRSQRVLSVGRFVLAHEIAREDIVNGGVVEGVSQGVAQQTDVAYEQLALLQSKRQYTWAGFFDEYLYEMFQDFSAQDTLWRDMTNLTPGQIIEQKRSELKSVKSPHRIAKARKRAAYLAIASLAHGDDPVAS